ncbi:MAG: mannose-6-phosphate isomerase [Chloroflexi bacterium]|jgi:mannose-6-phosphate isomerase|nr:mannose-6-phosphate isomerase [Chloroflexota bacterium]
MTERIYPLTFTPEFRDYIWGGRHLETVFGRQLPPGIVAESWDISGHPSSPTRADAGYWQGRTLPEIMEALGADLVGSHSAEMLRRGKFPLLVKLLDANKNLSVQVHPDDAYAREHEHGELGKTEMWYVLYAEPGTELIYGLAKGATRESFQAAIEQGTVEGQLHRVRIQAGDAVYVSAGSVHALLAGAVVAEIQQNSDITYRVYDWGRVGEDGKPRPLHIQQALDVIDWGLIEPGPVQPVTLADNAGMKWSRLVQSPHFSVERVELAAGAEFHGRCDGRTFEIWGCMTGEAAVHWADEPASAPVTVRAVRFVLLPAALGEYTIRATEQSTMLRAYV